MSTVPLNRTSLSESWSSNDSYSSSDSWEGWTGRPPVRARVFTEKPAVAVVERGGSTTTLTSVPNTATTPQIIPRTTAVPIGADGCEYLATDLLSMRGFLGGVLSGIGFSIVIVLIVVVLVCSRRRCQRKLNLTKTAMPDPNSPCVLNIETSGSMKRADASIEFDDDMYEDPAKLSRKADDTNEGISNGNSYVEHTQGVSPPCLLNTETSNFNNTITNFKIDHDTAYEDPIKMPKTGHTQTEVDDDDAYEEPIKVLKKQKEEEKAAQGSGDAELCFSDGGHFLRIREEDLELGHHICYDHEIQGKFNHTYATVDAAGMSPGMNKDGKSQEDRYQNIKRFSTGGYKGRRPQSLSSMQTTV